MMHGQMNIKSSDMFVLILGDSDALHPRGHLDRNTDR